ncbi:PA4780 family RIO1-like protein kinase [Marinicellulosiphila megalodicopiae]|uniref:PA4780 family RIO1-like protein kinase n=1 Tax=Marinicellulosiphila megalodicopiae TaxID=2724896 RepID=UPI003BAF4B5E
MKTPAVLDKLIEYGLIDEVLYSLMSGKEADVFVVKAKDQIQCAKVYKEAQFRSFKKAVTYQEGRSTRNSRRARAIEKGSAFGKQQQESDWQQTEYNTLHQLKNAGVRVPQAYMFIDGVLLMELVTTEDGEVAPRLNDIAMDAEQAIEDHYVMMVYVMRMLCEGLIHGDLSQFNVLADDYGPVVIDFPQVVNAAGNQQAQALFNRDVKNMTDYYAQFAPELAQTQYAKEIWHHFEKAQLHKDLTLTGEFESDDSEADVDSVMLEIKAALEEENERILRMSDDLDD